MRRFIKDSLFLLVCLIICVASAPAKAEQESIPTFLTLDSVTCQIVQFLGGPYIRVEYATKASFSKKKLETADYILSLDQAQYEGIPAKIRSKLEGKVCFLRSAEDSWGSLEEFPFDPSILPYVAQQTSAILGDLLPKRRSYFQRRLGEFDAKLNAVLITGKRRLNGKNILCASTFMIPFLQSFGTDVRMITQEDEKIFASAAAINDAKTVQKQLQPYKNISILLDWTTPLKIRNVLTQYANAVVLSESGGDLLHAIYTAILEL